MYSISKIVNENCKNCRAWILKYIVDRREGKRHSSIEGKTDILTLMLERPDVFIDEFMVDELLGFFGAATETTHNVLQTILTHLMQDNSSV